jgi:hypothetical protein
MVKILTMVKDENDIVRDWVIYHGNLFGYKNLYIIDNYSRDGTWEILQEFKGRINMFRLHNYKKKGEYMTYFLRRFCKNELVFPIDIDEFIVYHHKKTNKIICNKQFIHFYLNRLPKFPIFKMNYIQSLLTEKNGYQRAATQSQIGYYNDLGRHAKVFLNSQLFHGVIDHGNHYHTDNYILSNLCLVHFHCRNLIQMKKKVFNNVRGLGYTPFSIKNLENTLKNNQNCEGNHHIRNQIALLKKEYSLPVSTNQDNHILLESLTRKIKILSKKQLKQ